MALTSCFLSQTIRAACMIAACMLRQYLLCMQGMSLSQGVEGDTIMAPQNAWGGNAAKATVTKVCSSL